MCSRATLPLKGKARMLPGLFRLLAALSVPWLVAAWLLTTPVFTSPSLSVFLSPLLIRTPVVKHRARNLHWHWCLWEIHLGFLFSFTKLSLRSCLLCLNPVKSCFFVNYSTEIVCQGHHSHLYAEFSRLASDLSFTSIAPGICNTHYSISSYFCRTKFKF